MSKFIFNVRWDDGSTHTYEIDRGKFVFGLDPISQTKDRLNSSRSVTTYNIIDEIGNIIYSMGDSNEKLTAEVE